MKRSTKIERNDKKIEKNPSAGRAKERKKDSGFYAVVVSSLNKLSAKEKKIMNKNFTAIILAVLAMLVMLQTGASAADDVLARVGTKTITKADVDAMIGLFPPEQQSMIKMDPRSEQMLLTNLLDNIIVSDVAKKKGLDKTKKIQRQLDIIKNEFIAKSYVQNEIVAKVKVTDKDVEKYYNEHKQEFEKPETISARHILIAIKPDAKDSEKQDARKKAEGLLDRIKKGEDFAKLASDYSEDPGSKTRGGDLGTFPRKTMVEEFEKAAFALKPGEVSGVVETQFGYHIIKVDGKKNPEAPAFDSIKEQVKIKATQVAVQDKLAAFLTKARSAAQVEVYK
jgi:peptidyl-prolyl cis-trans isomerase C